MIVQQHVERTGLRWSFIERTPPTDLYPTLIVPSGCFQVWHGGWQCLATDDEDEARRYWVEQTRGEWI